MCEDFLALTAPGVAGLAPYQPGKPLSELEREHGIRDAVKLASNENPLGPSPLGLEAARAALAELPRYPDGNGFALKRALAEHLEVRMESITLGNGSNDVLELVARAFLTPETEAVFSQYGFAVYSLVTRAVGARAVEVPAVDWGHDLEAMADAVGERTRVVFIANPNNPTGTWVSREALEGFLERIPQRVLVVVDEAYFEYVVEPDYPNALDYLHRCPNLIVTRTFSKAYGLAGLRVGYGVSHSAVAEILNRVRQPFNVNTPALAAAAAALGDEAFLAHSRAINTTGMGQLRVAMTALGLEVIPSVGNFLTVRVPGSAAQIDEALLRRGVIVRPLAGYGMPEHLRISIGSESENARLIQAMGEVLEASGEDTAP
jgi:histidinol-phosphate aminotransferase